VPGSSKLKLAGTASIFLPRRRGQFYSGRDKSILGRKWP